MRAPSPSSASPLPSDLVSNACGKLSLKHAQPDQSAREAVRWSKSRRADNYQEKSVEEVAEVIQMPKSTVGLACSTLANG
jgi:type IV secretory pathway TraG/TraD family ATPase VirD4